MKLKDLEDAIVSMKEAFGNTVLENDIYMDFTFSNEIILTLGAETITTLCSIPVDPE